ncbi:MAG: hypothetical protein M3198_19260 [Actinomycetota bacterium]|nr:hypothetical protein [Actinomycetota bacterium]
MAGFDALFNFRSADLPLLKSMFSAARRRARAMDIRWRATVDEKNGICYLVLDGQTYGLDIFIERLRRDLPAIAEATSSSRIPSERRLVAHGFVEIVTRYRLSLYEYRPEDWIPTLRARREPIYALPHTLLAPKAPRLQQRLLVTMDLLASWHYEEVSPEVLLEEIHTAAELILEASVNRRAKKLSFAQLVERAERAGLLAGPWVETVVAGTRDPSVERYADEETRREKDLLLSLKDARKRVRHRGETGAKGWLDANFWDAVQVLEYLAPHAIGP